MDLRERAILAIVRFQKKTIVHVDELPWFAEWIAHSVEKIMHPQGFWHRHARGMTPEPRPGQNEASSLIELLLRCLKADIWLVTLDYLIALLILRFYVFCDFKFLAMLCIFRFVFIGLRF